MFERCETGIEDHNGTPIKEGDELFVIAHDIDPRAGLGIVEYDEDAAVFTIEFDTFFTDFKHVCGFECEVRGSIYDEEDEQ